MTTQTPAATRATEVKEAVLSLLERHPETRDDDKALMCRYWTEYDHLVFDYTFPSRFATEGTSPESITRARRAIQATGLYPPSQEAVLRRRQRQADLRDHFSNN